MKWSESLHEQMDKVLYRLDARAAGDRLWRAVRAAHQGPDDLSAKLKFKSLSELAPAQAIRS